MQMEFQHCDVDAHAVNERVRDDEMKKIKIVCRKIAFQFY